MTCIGQMSALRQSSAMAKCPCMWKLDGEKSKKAPWKLTGKGQLPTKWNKKGREAGIQPKQWQKTKMIEEAVLWSYVFYGLERTDVCPYWH